MGSAKMAENLLAHKCRFNCKERVGYICLLATTQSPVPQCYTYAVTFATNGFIGLIKVIAI